MLMHLFALTCIGLKQNKEEGYELMVDVSGELVRRRDQVSSCHVSILGMF